ncbi:MAG: glycosyltransferase family 4 protein [Melioribacter sp.]|uniref:glycosyltransferase family 4 protein n=1 Tax=Melioribacter sp. TaxID=2052167 RepID=UPI003BE2953C
MKVIHFAPYFSYASGTNTYLRHLLFALNKHGIEMSLLTNNRIAFNDVALQNIDIDFIRFETGIKNFFYIIGNLRSLSSKIVNNIDVVHSHHRYPELISNILKKRCRKTVATAHSRVYGLKHISFRSDGIIVPCKYLADYLVKNFNVRAGKIHVLYNCIEPELYDKFNSMNHVSRHSLNIKPDEIVFLYAGAICNEKGIDYLCEVFQEFSKDNENVKLILAGNIIDKRLTRYSSDKLIFTGYTKYPVAYYKLTDVLVHPSYNDVLPYAVLEAGYLGKIIIASETGGIPEIINGNENGFLFKAGDKTELRNLFHYVSNNLENCRRAGLNLQREIKEITSADKYVKSLMEIYESD